MTKQMEHPPRHRLRRCEGCGESFVDRDEEVQFCETCLAAMLDPTGDGPGRTVSDSERAAGSGPAAIKEPERVRDRSDSRVPGLPGKVDWTSPPFQVSWDQGEYLNQAEESLPTGRLPTDKMPARSRNRTLLALVSAVAVLVLISRLDAPGIEQIWRDFNAGKSAAENSTAEKSREPKLVAHPPLPPEKPKSSNPQNTQPGNRRMF